MITVRARLYIALFLLIMLAIIINMIRKRSMELKYTLVWMACVILMLLVVTFPNILYWLADMLGIYSVVNMVLFLGFLFLMVICFSLTIAISRATTNMRRMAQIVSMIPGDVKRDIEKRMELSEDEEVLD